MKKETFISTILMAATLLTSSCNEEPVFIGGSGMVTTQTLQIDPFTSIDVEGKDKVVITFGNEQKVEVAGHSNIIGRIRKDVVEGVWTIRLENGIYRDYELTYYLTLPVLKEIHNAGTGNIFLEQFKASGELDISISGAGSLEMTDLTGLRRCFVDLNGSGDVIGTGSFSTLELLDVQIFGTGKFLGYPVDAEKCRIDILGSGGCEVTVTQDLDVTIEGSGIVYYSGNPTLHQHIIGTGQVIKNQLP